MKHMDNEIDMLLPTAQRAVKLAKFPFPQSLCWRLNHSIAFMTGSVAFLFGSVQYFPSINDLSAGAGLFIIGSVAIVYADILEWSMNNRFGCCCTSERFTESYEYAMKDRFDSIDTLIGKLQRMERGVNFFLSVTGSFLYLIGSILFIPSLNKLAAGTYIFAIASIFIVISESWKIFRSGSTNDGSTNDKSFSLSNLSLDISGVLINVFTWIGGFGYLLGSVYYLPKFDTANKDTVIAATGYTIAGAAYVIAATLITFRYYFTINYLLRY